MNRRERRAAAKGARSGGSPTRDALFSEALQHHRAGQIDQADVLCLRILAADPRHAASLHLRGVIMQQAGRHDAAVELLGRALAVNARDADAHHDIGVSLRALGRVEQAAAAYQQAIRLNPGHRYAHNNLGSAFSALGQLDDAAQAFSRAALLTPDSAAVHHNLGNALAAQGKLADAERAFECALLAQSKAPLPEAPDYAAIFLGLGNHHQAQGRLEEAARLYERTLALKPDFGAAHNSFGALLLEQGRLTEAASRFARAVALTPELFDKYGELSDTLLKVNPALKAATARAANAWPRLLPVDELLGADGLAAVAADPMLRVMLVLATVRDMVLERVLISLRRALLDRASAHSGDADPAVLDFACALARQCFINEYVWALSAEELAEAARLKAAMIDALSGGRPIAALWLAAVASYFPLGDLPEAHSLLGHDWPDAVATLVTQQVREPMEERQDRDRIPRLTEIGEGVSARVRQQYEENPYPRWSVAPPRREPMSVDEDMHRKFPTATFRGLGEPGGFDLLVAGCGTGQHPIWLAQRYRGARVLAVDLSLSSLSYARRKTRELGLSNIEYAQTDLTRIESIERSFDMIDASGVLHHLRDPEAGWRLLLTLLRPRGVMRIGLYSVLGRRELAAARAFVTERAYRPTADDIRRCRQDLMDTPLASVERFYDFYSASECRDMLFHVQEHLFDLERIRSFVAANGLKFIGFELDAASAEAYRQRFPDDRPMTDLEHWRRFESERPDTFAAMYQFWVERL